MSRRYREEGSAHHDAITGPGSRRCDAHSTESTSVGGAWPWQNCGGAGRELRPPSDRAVQRCHRESIHRHRHRARLRWRPHPCRRECRPRPGAACTGTLAQVLRQHLCGRFVVRDIENPLHRSRHDLETSRELQRLQRVADRGRLQRHSQTMLQWHHGRRGIGCAPGADPARAGRLKPWNVEAASLQLHGPVASDSCQR